MGSERRLTAGRGVTGGTVALLAVGVVLVLAVVAAVTRPADGLRSPDPAGAGGVVSVPDRPAYTHLQMNLCLSGMAGCYPRDRYDQAIAAAVDAVRRTGADVVTHIQRRSSGPAWFENGRPAVATTRSRVRMALPKRPRPPGSMHGSRSPA